LETEEDNWRISHLICGFFVAVIASSLLLLFLGISNESPFMLVIFNFFFVSLTFPLNGTLARKIFMLLIGNIIGLLWNNLFSLSADALASYLGEVFTTLHIILSPFANLIWIVSFWSLSLTFLSNSRSRKAEAEP
jgi:hypothetical protein